jgi:hypothetical protein
MKLVDSLGFLIVGAILGVWAYTTYFQGSKKTSDPMPDVNQSILLERINKVTKMITVEGEFSNIHEYNDSYWADVSMLRKKAIVKVDAKVSVGYDLRKANFEVDAERKVLRVRNLPAPEVLAIDHDLQYYDIQEGMFNSFTEQELSSIGSVAKKKLRKAVEQGPLMEKAKEEGIESLEIIKLLVEQAGWRFEVQNDIVPPTALDQQIDTPVNIPQPLEVSRDTLLN